MTDPLALALLDWVAHQRLQPTASCPVVVAFSGGADSSALLHVAQQFRIIRIIEGDDPAGGGPEPLQFFQHGVGDPMGADQGSEPARNALDGSDLPLGRRQHRLRRPETVQKPFVQEIADARYALEMKPGFQRFMESLPGHGFWTVPFFYRPFLPFRQAMRMGLAT